MRLHRHEPSQKTVSTSGIKEFIRRHERFALDRRGNSAIKFDSLYARIFLERYDPSADAYGRRMLWRWLSFLGRQIGHKYSIVRR